MTKHLIIANTMKTSIPRTLLTLLGVLLVAGAMKAKAADVLKANNTSNLNLPASWVSGATPTSGDVAVWDSTVTAPNAVALGASEAAAGFTEAECPCRVWPR